MYLFWSWGVIKSSEGIDLQYGAHVNVSGLLFAHWENTFHHSYQLIFEFDSIHITLIVRDKHNVINIQIVYCILSV